jgi:hypothetical protein
VASVDLTVARFTIVPACVGLATRVMVTEEPFRSAPIVQVTTGPPAHEPAVADAETSCSDPGSASVTTTFVASPGPLFRTTSV